MALKMELNPPTGNDIAKLLLLCAPPNALKEGDLSEDTQEDFADHFNSLDIHSKSGIIALALYYAGRTIINFKKSYSLVSTLYIAPEVIHSLVQLVDAESFSETEGLLTEIEKNKKSKIGKSTNRVRVEKYRIIKDELKTYWKSHITHTLKASAAAAQLERAEIYKNSDTQPKRSMLEKYVREWQADNPSH
jgi:hypothetical protein